MVSSAEGLSKLNKAGNMHGAPLAVVVCGLADKAWKRPQDGHSIMVWNENVPSGTGN